MLMKAYNFEEFVRKSVKIRCTWMHVLPPVAVMLAKRPITQNSDFKDLKTIVCSESQLDKELIRVLRERAPDVVFTQKYGWALKSKLARKGCS